MGRSKKKKKKNKKKKSNKKKQSKKKKAADDIVVDKKKQEEQTELLEQIYSVPINDEFNTADLSKFYHKKRSFWKRGLVYTLLLLFMIILSSLAGYFYFNWEEPFDGDKVLFNINLKDNVTAGELLEINLNYNNLANVNLKDVEVTVQMPENFELVASQPKPKNEANNTWALSQIGANSLGEIKLTGYFNFEDADTTNSYEHFKANLYYYPENFSSLFKDEASKKIQVIKPKLAVQVIGENEVKLKENVDYKIIYENKEEKNLSGLNLKANIPNNFVVTEITPDINDQKKYDTFTELHWQLSDLKSGEKRDVNISGYFQDLGNSNEDVIYGEIYTQDNDLRKIILSAANLPVSLQGGDLLLTLHINDLVNKQHLDNQSSLAYTIFYKNMGDEDLEDVSLDLMVDDFVSKDPLIHILNWNTSQDEYDGSVHRTEGGARVNWDINNIPELDVLEPNEEGTITFYIDKYNNSHFNGVNNWRDFLVNNYLLLNYKIAGSDTSKEYKSNEVYFNYQQMLNLDNNDFTKIGKSSNDKNLYQLLYNIDTANSLEEYYNLVFHFTLTDNTNWVDLNKTEIENEEIISTEDKIYSQYYDEFKEKLVVKFDDLSKCEASCSFSVVIESDKECSTADCLFNEIKGSVWYNNEVMWYNP